MGSGRAALSEEGASTLLNQLPERPSPPTLLAWSTEVFRTFQNIPQLSNPSPGPIPREPGEREAPLVEDPGILLFKGPEGGEGF